MSDDKTIKLTEDMVVRDRATAKDIGKALVRANKLGLRIVKGGKVSSEEIAKKLISKLGKQLND